MSKKSNLNSDEEYFLKDSIYKYYHPIEPYTSKTGYNFNK